MVATTLPTGLAPNPHTDRLPQTVLDADPLLVQELTALLGPENVLATATDRTRYASDASPYRMLPSIVVRPRHAADLQQLMAWATRSGHSLTVRAGGTSLNGQAQTHDVLVDLREHFGLDATGREGIEVLDDGARVRVLPGVVLGRVNAHLARHHRVMGPDPASAAAATIGGVLAKNASGMTCGVHANSFRTIESIVVVLPSGTLVDTASPTADDDLRASDPHLYAELLAIRDEVRADEELAGRILRKFSIKNTSGLRLDAFCEAERPIEILKLLMVGSEGILGVVVDTLWRTIPTSSSRTTGFLHFPDPHTATSVVAALNAAGAQTVELIDSNSLLASRGRPGTPSWVDDLPAGASDTVLLTERRSEDPAELAAFEDAVRQVTAGLLVEDAAMTRDARLAADYWRVRQGLFTVTGAARPAGTTLLTEDVVVPVDRLSEALVDLQGLLERHGFLGAVNGHAGAGNLHFCIYVDPTDPAQVAGYRALMHELVALVVDRYDGSLKGEHGAGRNMSPFIEREWGQKATALMWRVKRAFDPHGILAPGVFLDDDPEATVKNLKSIPTVGGVLDPCIECGFCEPVCPSRHVTTTPRQRIVVQREMARREGPDAVRQRLVDEYRHDAVETCAGDSTCALACPVGIDTGHAMKALRQGSNGALAEATGNLLAGHWAGVGSGALRALSAAQKARPVMGDRGLSALTGLARRIGGEDLVPAWLPETPPPAAPVPPTSREGAEAVYFTACINRIFGPSASACDDTGIAAALVALAQRAGHPLWIPDDVGGLCCATVWRSKGLERGNRRMAAEMVDALWRWSDQGRLPVVVDASSCTLGIARELVDQLDETRRERHARIRVLDATTFVREVLVPDLPAHAKQALAVVHPTCSMQQLGIVDDLRVLAGQVADEVFVPVVATCCGFAGDRGMLHPELTGTATREEADEVRGRLAEGVTGEAVFVCGNRTCELGLEHATGQPYESVVVALERLTRS